MDHDELTLFLSGDVMLGRGVDQILPHPGDPALREGYIQHAHGYVDLAEDANGPIPAPVEPGWPWGDALTVLDEAAPDLRILNLETSITRSDDFVHGKRVHYRMSPGNVDAVTVARPDLCVLANNHVMDFGVAGLIETLGTLDAAGVATVGAGRDLEEARAPVVLTAGERQVLVFAVGMTSSGVPADWSATHGQAGVHVVDEPTGSAATSLAAEIERQAHADDIVILSVHWGSNWGYDIPASQHRFAHAMIEAGVDLVHGHSSHHPRPVEVHRDRLILYGCGDLINDYEGISGREEYRSDLRLLYLPVLERDSGALVELTMIPMRSRRLRLEHATDEERDWLAQTLDRVCRNFGAGVGTSSTGRLELLVA